MGYKHFCMFNCDSTLFVIGEYCSNSKTQKRFAKPKKDARFTRGIQQVSTWLMQTCLHGFANDSKSSGIIIVINWTVSQNKETDYLLLLRRITRELSLPCSQAPSVGATVMIR